MCTLFMGYNGLNFVVFFHFHTDYMIQVLKVWMEGGDHEVKVGQVSLLLNCVCFCSICRIIMIIIRQIVSKHSLMIITNQTRN